MNTDFPEKDGLLQEFIEPIEDYNNEYLVNWSERLITLERVICNNSYLHKYKDNYEKYCTMPQMTKWCSTINISSQLLKSMFTKQTNMMAEHINSFFKQAVTVKFMNLVFRIDKNKQIVFLYCRRLNVKTCAEGVGLPQVFMDQQDNDLVEKVPNFVMNSITGVLQHNTRSLRLNKQCHICLRSMSSREC